MGLINLQGVLAKGVCGFEGGTRICSVAVKRCAIESAVQPFAGEILIDTYVVLKTVTIRRIGVAATIEHGCVAWKIERGRRAAYGRTAGVHRIKISGRLDDGNIGDVAYRIGIEEQGSDRIWKGCLGPGSKGRIVKRDVLGDCVRRAKRLDGEEKEAGLAVRNDGTADDVGDVIAVEWIVLLGELCPGEKLLVRKIIAGGFGVTFCTRI